MTTQITEPESTPGDLLAPNGKVWRRTEHTRGGSALYVIDGIDPSTCPKLVMSTRMELEAIFGTELHPLGGAA
ncbi:hypothetical protein [Streptomyces sp. NPDC056105]|uniref:hypothetical protein n=1 Tax=Streptomyces sp. NPDC056105 TaxID=3345714 RepID=UPI0035E3647D